MKRFAIALFVIAVTGLAQGAAKSTAAAPKNPLLASDTVIWAGLDYSMVRMFGTEGFTNPDEIFPGMLNAWNSLFLQERWHERLGKALKQQVKVDTGGMSERNKLAKPDQVVARDGDLVGESHIKDADIAAAVKSYQMENKSGLGLVFIVDRLVKSQQQGALYAVYFDVATREVISSKRLVRKAGGFGVRNYWFRVVKDAGNDLKK